MKTKPYFFCQTPCYYDDHDYGHVGFIRDGLTAKQIWGMYIVLFGKMLGVVWAGK